MLLLVVGLVSRHRVNHLEDYYLAGRSLSIGWAVPSIVATWFGAGSVLGVAAAVHADGVGSVIPDPFGCSLALAICACWYAGKVYKANLLTVNELVRRAYGGLLERLCSVATLPFYIGTAAAQLVAIGYLIHTFAGQPLTASIAFAGVTVAGYTMLGGMWAVVMTDLVQLTFLILGIGALLVPIYTEPGHMTLSVSHLLEGLSELGPRSHASHGYLPYIGQITMTGLGALMGQDLMQRVFACKDERTAKISLWLSSGLYLCLGLCVVLLGYYSRLVLTGSESDEVIFALARRIVSPTVLLFFILGILSATMSTADGYLLAGSSIVCHGIFRFQEKGKNKLLLRARMCGLSLCAIATLLALFTQNIYGLMVHSGAFLFVSLFVPVTGALLFKNPPRASGWASLIAGFTGWVGYLVFHHAQWSVDLDSLLYAAALMGASFSAFSFLTVYGVSKVINQSRATTPVVKTADILPNEIETAKVAIG